MAVLNKTQPLPSPSILLLAQLESLSAEALNNYCLLSSNLWVTSGFLLQHGGLFSPRQKAVGTLVPGLWCPDPQAPHVKSSIWISREAGKGCFANKHPAVFPKATYKTLVLLDVSGHAHRSSDCSWTVSTCVSLLKLHLFVYRVYKIFSCLIYKCL